MGSIAHVARPQHREGRRDDAEGDRGVAHEVQERRLHVQVAVATAEEEQRRRAVDDDRRRRHGDHPLGGDRFRSRQAADGLRGDGSGGDEQENTVGQRRDERQLSKSVRAPPRRRALGQNGRAARERQPEDVAHVVASVGEERHRMRRESEDRFGDDHAEVEKDPHEKREPRIGHVPVRVVAVVVRVTRVIARVVAGMRMVVVDVRHG